MYEGIVMQWMRSCAPVTLGCMMLAVAVLPAGGEPHTFTFEELPTAAELAVGYKSLRPLSAKFHDQEEQSRQADGQNQESADGQPRSPAAATNSGMHPAAKGALIGTAAGFVAGCYRGAHIDTPCAGTGLVFALPGAGIGALTGWLASRD